MYLRFLAPNFLTACNFCLGLLSLWLCLKGQFTQVWLGVLACTLFDGLDGWIARRLAAESTFGRFFDSCADFVSFGCVPAFAFWLRHPSTVGWSAAVALIYLSCAMLRLIRFHRLCLNESTSMRRSFVGLPTTASSGLYATVCLLFVLIPAGWEFGLFLILAALMVSNLRFPSLNGLVARMALVRTGYSRF